MKIERFHLTTGHQYVKIVPPSGASSPPVPSATVIVIDISGSMNEAAAITQDTGEKVKHGWSQLDIAKHSTNTFISSLGEADYVCVITYSDDANVLVNGSCVRKTTRGPRSIRFIQCVPSDLPTS